MSTTFRVESLLRIFSGYRSSMNQNTWSYLETFYLFSSNVETVSLVDLWNDFLYSSKA
jgi:hypothetical protein